MPEMPGMINRPDTGPNGEAATARPALRMVLPSDGELYEPTLAFMRDCGLRVLRPNARRYTGSVPALPGTEVLFQRSADIARKVEEGSAELGVTGLDRVLEYRNDHRRAAVLVESLGYGRCEFVLAVPNSWLDVTSLADLADLALEFRQEGKQLRIATKYPRLLRSFLYEKGINHFTLVPASGTMEAAPAAGYADLIADLTATGTTLRENNLKTLDGGTVLISQACLVANPALLSESPDALDLAQAVTDMMDARLRAEPYYRVTANVQGASAEEVSAMVLAAPPWPGFADPPLPGCITWKSGTGLASACWCERNGCSKRFTTSGNAGRTVWPRSSSATCSTVTRGPTTPCLALTKVRQAGSERVR